MIMTESNPRNHTNTLNSSYVYRLACMCVCVCVYYVCMCVRVCVLCVYVCMYESVRLEWSINSPLWVWV